MGHVVIDEGVCGRHLVFYVLEGVIDLDKHLFDFFEAIICSLFKSSCLFELFTTDVEIEGFLLKVPQCFSIIFDLHCLFSLHLAQLRNLLILETQSIPHLRTVLSGLLSHLRQLLRDLIVLLLL